ncbi:hypothetical protein [Steroidobacter agaridevorans]|uniref:hypothetical protein n=1 Tax=Steroidobacter agaridevorans TaxID=2695856 RepID=UPI001324469A|nr:hypothetical protein [Steroidobacter agaridevorans]GFE88716.1 hypothetical protein GCM10011488_36700 [Steroidobacter agaridevorans]
MSKFARGVLMAVMCCQFGAANAAAYGIGQLGPIGGQGLGPNLVYFALSPAPVNRAACNNHISYQFVIDISNADGKALYSSLLMAKASGLSVAVQGTGVCHPGTQMETVSYWILQPEQ